MIPRVKEKNEVAKSNSVINVSLILFVFVFRTPTSHTLFFTYLSPSSHFFISTLQLFSDLYQYK